eukprot:COSAG06_NODE_2534_length_6710_cov_23.487521_5_plen_114_part_00
MVSAGGNETVMAGWVNPLLTGFLQVRQQFLASTCCRNMIVLPRQARDKKQTKGNSLTNEAGFLQPGQPAAILAAGKIPPANEADKAIGAGKTPFEEPFYTKNDRFTKTGSRQA